MWNGCWTWECKDLYINSSHTTFKKIKNNRRDPLHILYCCPITNQQIYPRNSSFHFEISDWLSERLTDLLNKMVVMPLKKPLPQNGDINTVLTGINDLLATFLGKWYNGFWLVVINFWFEAVFIRNRQWQTVIETSSFSSSRVSSSLPKWNNESLEFLEGRHIRFRK